MNLSYTPIHETTTRFHRSDAFARFLLGPIGCGKSYAILWEILRRAAQQPVSAYGTRRSRVIFVRNTRQMMLDSVLPILREVFPEGTIGTWRASESVYQVRVNDIECDILLRPLEDDSDIRRVLSINATFCVVDEWREIPVSTIIQLAGRAGRFPPKEEEGCAYAGVFGASNPPNEDSDWYKVLEIEKPESWEVFKFPSALSPEATWRKFLRDGYYENLMQGGTPEYIRVMIEGKYGRSMEGRSVFEHTFVYDFHVATEPLVPVEYNGHPVVVGIDFGRTPAAAFMQRDARGRILVLDEVYVENTGLERFLQEHVKPLIAERFSRNRITFVGDPAGWARSQLNEENVEDVFRRCGLVAIKAPTNDADKRVAAVERVLMLQTDGKASFLIDPRCTNIIRGFAGGYRYKRKSDGTYETKPAKDANSHLADAVQYGVLGIDTDMGSLRQHRREIKDAPYAFV